VQAFLRWTPPGGTLGTICREAEARASLLEQRAAELERLASVTPSAPSLEAALRGADVRVIAEVKRRSPSKGAIAPALDARGPGTGVRRGWRGGDQCAHGAGPLRWKHGRSASRARQRRGAGIEEGLSRASIQLVEARALGASAALLIARALSEDLLREMSETARDLALEVLVEVRDEAELERALEVGATMIGVNNRDLETLVIDPGTAERLVPRIPSELIAIAESGVSTRADIERYAARGADAVLVGSSISAAADPIQATRALAGVPRRARGH
jgi:indole-3-glycerol phosphate synthase